MKLKKVELAGFKSFADRATVLFTSGLNAIVGPNGCGKSNITDAFKWVLGEQSTKSLRASNMQEVIFHGTTKRKPVNVAEVTITFSNIDRFLPLEYTEVAVTRKLYRNGESQYFLNKQPIRLRDLHDLFAHSGVGKEAFAIIEQGRVDSLVKEAPLQRRVIFEEAAGIMRFLDKRRESVKKLERSKEALSRVQDLVQEVDRQLVHLEKQVEEAKRFQQDRDEIKQLELAQMKRRFTARENKTKRLCEQLEKLQHEQEELEERSHELLKSLEVAKSARTAQAEVRMKATEKLYGVKTEKEVLDREMSSLSEEKMRIQKRIQDLELESRRRKDEEQRIVTSSAKNLEELEKKIEELNAIDQKVSACLSEYAKKQKEVEVEDVQLFNDMAKVRAEEKELQQKEAERRAQEVLQESLKNRCSEKEKRRVMVLQDIERETNQREQLQMRIKELSQDKKKLSDELAALIVEVAACEKELQALKELEKQEERALIQHQARYSSFERMKEEMQGLSAGAKAILKETKKNQSPLFAKVKPLAHVLQQDIEQNECIELFGRLYNSTLVVEKEEELQLVFEFAKKEKLQEISIVCLEYLPAHASLSEYLFSRVVVADLLEEGRRAIQDGSRRAVFIKGGLYIDTSGVIFLGKESAKETNLLLQDRELKVLKGLIQTVQESLSKMHEKRQEIEQKCAVLKNREKSQELELKNVDRELFEKNILCERCHKMVKDFSLENERLTHEIDEIVLQEQKIRATDLHEKEALQAKKIALQHIQENLLKRDQLLRSKKNSWKLLSEEKNILDEKAKFLRQEKSKLEVAKETGAIKLEEIKRVLHVFQDDLASLDARAHELEDKLQICRTKKQELESEYSSMQKSQQDDAMLYKDAEQKFVELENATAATFGTKQDIAVKIQEIESARLAISEQQELLSQELSERFSTTKDELFEQEYSFSGSEAELERRLQQLRLAMQGFQHVNLRSLEDFESCRERKQFLGKEIQDIEASCQELLERIEELEKESREQFLKAFHAIKEGFCRNFETLFEGGQADLLFTETDDPLTCGIELVAKPPGKELKSVHLLSGGEKCLTALALLFAIFEVRPAPFCILDEVDAPLDELNVDRFNKMIKKYAEHCQFLIISHNKRTMLHADKLIGVSMQEKGVSQVLQLELQKEVALV